MTKLATRYDLDKSNLTAPGIHLVIGTRHKPEASKPKSYLLKRLPGGRHEYISSLYPTPKNATSAPKSAENWFFDYQGASYQLTLRREQGKAEIMPYSEGGSANP